MTHVTQGIAMSVQTRLVKHAKVIGVDPNLVLARYATERLLYRLSRSPYVDQFVLKGALLLAVWLGETIRPTRDADLLGLGTPDANDLATIFTAICVVVVEPDGILFDTDSIRVAAIRPEDAYGGHRITMVAHLGTALLRVQVDVGIGDAVTPEPEWLDYPSMLDLPRPRLRAYQAETAIAEKVHAMVVLGRNNSRMKDFFDLQALAVLNSFDGRVLSASMRNTFARRGTTIPSELPVAFTTEFAEIDGKRAQWIGFLRRNRLMNAPTELSTVVEAIGAFVLPVLIALRDEVPYQRRWPAGGPWME